MKPYVINDLHIGTQRITGTTMQSQLALREYLLREYGACLNKADDALIVLGDLFDNHSIPMSDVLAAYDLTADWLKRTGHKLWLVAGNHDLSTNSLKVSSFQFFAQVLVRTFPEQVSYVEGSCRIGKSLHIISHVTNQDLFDMELDNVGEARYLLLHANYDNNFAKEADHSLNLSAERAASLKVGTVFFAHEHYGRKAKAGDVEIFVAGNQFPSSVSDCLGEKAKYMHRLTADGIQRIETWNSSDYCEMDWCHMHPTDARFIRITGSVDPAGAAHMADAIAKYRRGSTAFVVGNAVRVTGKTEVGGLDLEDLETTSLESVRAFDVRAALKSKLDADEWAVIEGLK